MPNYLQHAKMLVPKFSCQCDGAWHIQWPKDLPTVIHAKTQEELVMALATRLRELSRVGNKGTHVVPAYSCDDCPNI